MTIPTKALKEICESCVELI